MTQQEYSEMYAIIGAAMEVHHQLGRGLSEAIYQESLALELKKRDIQLEQEKQLSLYYKGEVLKKKYYVDMYYNGLIIELKSTDHIISEHRAQLFNYMRISKTARGVLINFGEKSLRAERYLLNLSSREITLINDHNIKDILSDNCPTE